MNKKKNKKLWLTTPIILLLLFFGISTAIAGSPSFLIWHYSSATPKTTNKLANVNWQALPPNLVCSLISPNSLKEFISSKTIHVDNERRDCTKWNASDTLGLNLEIGLNEYQMIWYNQAVDCIGKKDMVTNLGSSAYYCLTVAPPDLYNNALVVLKGSVVLELAGFSTKEKLLPSKAILINIAKNTMHDIWGN